MKPHQQGFIPKGSGGSREYESESDWGWWQQMLTQASEQNRNRREKYITTEERTLLDRQSSITRAQYDIAKHELLSNSSISVVQNIDLKLRNRRHLSEKPKRIQANVKLMDARDKSVKEGTSTLNECCSYCNLTTAHVNERKKGQRHRLGVAHNILGRTNCVELSSRSNVKPQYKVDKRKHGRHDRDRLKAKPVQSDTMTSSGELQTVMIKVSPEKAQLIKDSTMFDKTVFKSKKVLKKYHLQAERSILPERQDYLQHEAKCVDPSSHANVLSEREINSSKYDSWYSRQQSHQEGNKLISLEETVPQQKFQLESGTPSVLSNKFLQLQVASRPPEVTKKYRQTMQKPSKRKYKTRFSKRKERTETRTRIELNHAISVDSAENSTLREEYSTYNKNNVLRQAAEIKSSLALNIDCNKNNKTKPWKESPPQTGMRELEAKGAWIGGHELKRCSCELTLYGGNQSESESMIINILNPTNENVDSELLSSLFESNDFVVKSGQRKSTSSNTDINNFTSLSVLRAVSKGAHTCLNVKEDDYVSASSNLIAKPALANLHKVCENSIISLKLKVASSQSYQSQEADHLFDRSVDVNDRIVQKRLCMNDSQSTIRNVCGVERGNISANNALPSMIDISSLSLLHSREIRTFPRMEYSTSIDNRTSRNLLNLKNISAVSFILSSVTITDNIQPTVCRRNRIIIPTSTDISEYLEIPKIQPITDSVLQSSSKISLFQSDSISHFLRVQKSKELISKNSLSSVTSTSTCRLVRANNALTYLDNQNALSISRPRLLGDIEITKNNVKQEEFYEMKTLKKSPGKNVLDKHVAHSQFSRSFCTMNVRIPCKSVTFPTHTREKNKCVEEEPILSVLYHKDLSTRPKERIKTDTQMRNVSKVTRRSAPKEWSQIVKPSKSQKHISSNLKKAKLQKIDRCRISKYTIFEKPLVSKGFTTQYKQELQPKLVRRDHVKSSKKRLSSNRVQISTEKVAQIGTNLSFNTDVFIDIKSWPTSYPVTSESRDRNQNQRKKISGHNENESLKILHRSDDDTGGESKVRVPSKITFIMSQTQLRDHKDKLNINNRLPLLYRETETNKGWKSVINKCVKTIKSMRTKKAPIPVNTNMSAEPCYSKCNQWEETCYFCTNSPKIPIINKLSTKSKQKSNLECMGYKDDNNLLKRCCGTMDFHTNRKTQDTCKRNESNTPKVYNKISAECPGPAKIIYQNPATFIYSTWDSCKCSKNRPKNHRTLGTRTVGSNMTIVSTKTSQYDLPLYKSKSIQSIELREHRSKGPRNLKSYDIETIFPLTSNKFHKSKSEIIFLQSNNVKCQNTDESNIPNSFLETQLYSVSKKNRHLKKRKEPNVNKVKPTSSKKTEHVVRPSVISLTNIKKFLIRFAMLFMRKNKTQAETETAKSKVNEFDSKHFCKEGEPSFKSLKQHRKHIQVQGDDIKKSKSDRQRKQSDSLSRHEKCKGIVITKEPRKSKLDKRSYQETTSSKGNNSRYESGDVNSFASKISECQQSKGCSHPSNCYRQNKLCCGYAQIEPNKVVKENRIKLLRESLHKNVDLPRFHLSDKTQKKMKKTNCQVLKKDVGTNCIRKKRFKNKTKCIQATLWDEETVLIMSGDGRNEPMEKKQNKRRRMMFGKEKTEISGHLPGNEKNDATKETNYKNETNITRKITTKCKNFLKLNKPPIEQALAETNLCYRHVDCEGKRKIQMKNQKELDIDSAIKVKYTQTPPKTNKAKSTKPAYLVKTAVKALQVDDEKRLKDLDKVRQMKCAVKPKELFTLPFRNDGKKNEATICNKSKQKNKCVKTLDADPFLCCKTTSTSNLFGAKTHAKQKPAKIAARDKKTLPSLSPVNRENDIYTIIKSAKKSGVGRAVQGDTTIPIEELLLHEPTKKKKHDINPRCATTCPTNKIGSRVEKQNKVKTKVKVKKGKSTQKAFKARDNDLYSVSNTSSRKNFLTKKQKKTNAKTRTALSLNKAVMTHDILVSSCCTNTTPSIENKIGTKISAKHKQERSIAKDKKGVLSNRAVETKDVYVSSRSTNTITSCDKKVEAKINVKTKQDNNGLNTIRAVSCPRTSTAKVNLTGISVKHKKQKTTGRRKLLPSDSSENKYGKPFIKSTQTKVKCKAKQINTTQEERSADKKGKTKIYTTEDKQTSASSKCMPPLTTEAPVKYSTMMSANRTKQVCCALFTAGAWHNSKAVISQSSHASPTYNEKSHATNLQVMTNHGVTCNIEKQKSGKKSKYVNAVEKKNGLGQEFRFLLSKSSPCCICSNEICEDCKVKFIKSSTEKGPEDKKSIKLKNKGINVSKKTTKTKPASKQKTGVKVVTKPTTETIQRNNKRLAKEAKKMEKLNKVNITKEAKETDKSKKSKMKSSAKQIKELEKLDIRKNEYAAKQIKEMEKLHKRELKSLEKEAKKMEKLNKSKNESKLKEKETKKMKKINKSKDKTKPKEKETKKMEKINKSSNKTNPKEKKKGNIIKVQYLSVKEDRPRRKQIEKMKGNNRNVQRETKRIKKLEQKAKVKKIRIPFAFLTCSSRTGKRNASDSDCQQLYKTSFRRRMILFIYVRSCCYFVRSTFRRLLGCLLFGLGVIVWTPCICCFECFRECLFCCCAASR